MSSCAISVFSEALPMPPPAAIIFFQQIPLFMFKVASFIKGPTINMTCYYFQYIQCLIFIPSPPPPF